MKMKAMLLEGVTALKANDAPLRLAEVARPAPQAGEVLLKIVACGVCHTELDEIEGRTAPPQYPVIPGHQVVGEVVELGKGVAEKHLGQRVGVAWIYEACGKCDYCNSGRENLCREFKATGRDVDGGYAEYMLAPAQFTHPLPDEIDTYEAAPLLCAGAIGYRSLRLTGLQRGQRLGLTGFGASAHLVLKLLKTTFPGSECFVFARNAEERKFALELGAVWAGDTNDPPPRLLHAIIDTTPAWKPLVAAMKCLAPGGRLVINAIRKESGDRDYLSQVDYSTHLWEEKELKSVANVTKFDVREFLKLAGEARIRPDYQLYPLEQANLALSELKAGLIKGAKVLAINR